MTEPVYIARCPVHGYAVGEITVVGVGSEMFCMACGGPVEQVPMIPVEEHRVEMDYLRGNRDFHRARAEKAEAELAALAAGPWTGRLDREEAIKATRAVFERDCPYLGREEREQHWAEQIADAVLAMQGGDAR